MSLKTLIRKEAQTKLFQSILVISIKHVQSIAHMIVSYAQDCTSTKDQRLVKDPSHPMDTPATEAELCCAANVRSHAFAMFDFLNLFDIFRQKWDTAYDAETGSSAATSEPTKAHLREGLSNQVKAPDMSRVIAALRISVLLCFADSHFCGRSAQVATPRHFRESKRSPEHVSRNHTLMALTQELSRWLLKHPKPAIQMNLQGMWLTVKHCM